MNSFPVFFVWVQKLIRQTQKTAQRYYYPKVLFFFLGRKKDKPNDSYITAEYRYGKLYQIKEKNNYSVTNPEATKFAKEFCEKLSKTKYFKNI